MVGIQGDDSTTSRLRNSRTLSFPKRFRDNSYSITWLSNTLVYIFAWALEMLGYSVAGWKQCEKMMSDR